MGFEKLVKMNIVRNELSLQRQQVLKCIIEDHVKMFPRPLNSYFVDPLRLMVCTCIYCLLFRKLISFNAFLKTKCRLKNIEKVSYALCVKVT